MDIDERGLNEVMIYSHDFIQCIYSYLLINVHMIQLLYPIDRNLSAHKWLSSVQVTATKVETETGKLLVISAVGKVGSTRPGNGYIAVKSP